MHSSENWSQQRKRSAHHRRIWALCLAGGGERQFLPLGALFNGSAGQQESRQALVALQGQHQVWIAEGPDDWGAKWTVTPGSDALLRDRIEAVLEPALHTLAIGSASTGASTGCGGLACRRMVYKVWEPWPRTSAHGSSGGTRLLRCHAARERRVRSRFLRCSAQASTKTRSSGGCVSLTF